MKYPKNLGYLNINSFRNKITDVQEMIGRLQFAYFMLSETKIDSSSLPTQLHIGDYEIRDRRDRD